MHKVWARVYVLFATALCLMSGACTQIPFASIAAMPLGAAVLAPKGYLAFCQERPDQCGISTPMGAEDRAALRRDLAREEWQSVLQQRPTAITEDASYAGASRSKMPRADDPDWQLVDRINTAVNAKIVPATDPATIDSWSLPPDAALRPSGDCKRYVLEKRRMLAAAGVPARALSIAIVRTRAGETHAVLLVATDKGEFVLDNLSAWIIPWSEARYRWLERQVPGSPLRWVAVAVADS